MLIGPHSRRWFVMALAVVACATLARAQAPADSTTLAVAGEIPHPFTVTVADLKSMPRTSVTIPEDGRDVKYEGVLVGELLKRAGAPLGRDLNGPAMASYVLASAKDGYEAVFSIGELDPALTSDEIIVADSVDGKPLFDYQGPFRIVAPHDKRGARGVRMLAKLEVVRLKK